MRYHIVSMPDKKGEYVHMLVDIVGKVLMQYTWSSSFAPKFLVNRMAQLNGRV